MTTCRLPTQFGLFYPTGWIVAAFADRESAERVQRDLFAGGYDDDDCRLAAAEDVVPIAQGQLERADWLAQLGKADEALKEHLAAAQKGSTFLIIQAASDEEAARVMKVVRREPFELAHRYHRFAIEDIK